MTPSKGWWMLEVRRQEALSECDFRGFSYRAVDEISGVWNEIHVSGVHLIRFVCIDSCGSTQMHISDNFSWFCLSFMARRNRMLRWSGWCHPPACIHLISHSNVDDSAFLIKFYCCKWFSLESCAGFVHASSKHHVFVCRWRRTLLHP